MRKTIYITLFAVALILLMGSATLFAQSCPMCKESMTAAGAKLSDGFYYSIMSMFTLPFALGGTIGGVVFKSWYDRANPGNDLTLWGALRATIKKTRTH